MTRFDYVIVGSGPAGCVLANRLSSNPDVGVLLIEAGGTDSNPLISMPRGFGALFGDPSTVWLHPTRSFGPAGQCEHWVRGRTLGGSSSVNGMIYNRGSRADYDMLERIGNPGWGWSDILPAFTAIEDNELGASDVRGTGGPLHVSTVDGADPLLDDVLAAGSELGWRCVPDLNETDDERIGYAMATIRDGRRCSAATAFLHPVLDRPNLTVAMNTVVDQVVLEGNRAIGVRGRANERRVEAHAGREVILAAGTIATPKILQLSGIGHPDTLRSAGVDVVVDSPNVGARLREHRVMVLQYRLNEDIGDNTLLSTESGQRQAADQYQATRTGPMATPGFEIVGFFKTRPELARPDAQFQIAPFSILPFEPGEGMRLEREPGVMGITYALRPDSEGSVHISSADPDAPVDIDPNYFATEHDRGVSVDALRGLRRLFATAPLKERIEYETAPGDRVQTDQAIIDAGLTTGTCGYHAIGTCAMGPEDDDVVDPCLRVRGTTNLRVVDASVLPIMVSGNLNGPVSALAWRAADIIDGVRAG